MGEVGFNKVIVRFFFTGVMTINGFLSIKWFTFLLAYNEHQGFENGVFVLGFIAIFLFGFYELI
ncbi:hypothetical protein SAMN06295967_11545 [Belliella buryatensis]|uniref:Uncharacterized protein n=1 Tax=Belliella buryatensis TaxID=1500549 RepID=A0A239G8X0_9BACT|nr:hypothetical protein SAMN06295967_11545 [Belliella buryatensis]